MIDKTANDEVQKNIVTLTDSLIKAQKTKLRYQVLAKRDDIESSSPRYMEAAEAVMYKVLDTLPLTSDSIISGYWPMGSELDLRPTLTFLSQTHRVCLPQVADSQNTLLFKAWTPQSSLRPGSYEIMEPQSTQEYIPTICLIPLIAFDRHGHRLGYGGGYFDKYLHYIEQAGHPILKVGIAYAEQEVSEIPQEETDHMLDWVITPKEVIFINHPSSQVQQQ